MQQQVFNSEEKARQHKEANQQEQFVIDNDERANWAFRKIRHKKEKIKEKEELAQETIDELEEEIKEVELWLEEEITGYENDIEYFNHLLRGYARQLKKEDENFKTNKLPFGQIQFRKQRPKWKYENDELLKSIKQAGFSDTSIVQTKEKVNKNELKAAVTAGVIEKTDNGNLVNSKTGEIIEGVKIIERGEKIKVKVKE